MPADVAFTGAILTWLMLLVLVAGADVTGALGMNATVAPSLIARRPLRCTRGMDDMSTPAALAG